jgi:hypothetical protein
VRPDPRQHSQSVLGMLLVPVPVSAPRPVTQRDSLPGRPLQAAGSPRPPFSQGPGPGSEDSREPLVRIANCRPRGSAACYFELVIDPRFGDVLGHVKTRFRAGGNVTQARPPAAVGALAAFLFLLSWVIVLVSAVLAYGDRRAVPGADGPGVRVVGNDDACGPQLVDQACCLTWGGDQDGITSQSMGGGFGPASRSTRRLTRPPSP